jgi:ATP-binding cassette subfamily B protein
MAGGRPEKACARGKRFKRVEVDLDAKLRFTKGILVVTNRRLLARAPATPTGATGPTAPGLALRHHDHAGVGHLELVDAKGLLAAWRFTLGQNLQAIRVVDQFPTRSTAT